MSSTHQIFESERHLTEAKAYWQNTLRGSTTTTPLGVEQKSTVQFGDNVDYGREKTTLSKETTEALRQFGNYDGVDPETLLHGAWAILLSRYSSETEVVFGSISIEGLDASAIKSLPLKIEVDSTARVGTWLKHLEEQRSVLCGKDISLAQLKTWGAVSPEHSLFESGLILGDAGDALINAEDGGSSMRSLLQEMHCPLLVLASMRERLKLELVYSDTRFSEDAIRRVSGHLVTLLEGVATNSEQRLSELPLLTAAERQQLAEWNNTEREYPKQICMHELFEMQVERTPEDVAVVFHESRVTYRELNRRANQLAHYLRRFGVGPEVQVGILLDRSVEMIVALLGVLKAGGAYVPLDPEYPAERLAFMIEDAEAVVLITREALRPRIAGAAVNQVIVLEEEESWSGEKTENLETGVSADNLAYVIYTSGSTGRPKGVGIAHQNAATLIHWAREIFSAEELQGMLASTSICFDLSVFELFVPLSWGGKVILVEHVLALRNLAGKSEVRLINTGPSLIGELVRMQGIPAEVRVVNLAGEALPRPLVDQLYEQETIERVVNLYGPSEDTTYSTFATMKRGDHGRVVIGRPIANTRAFVVDANGLLAPVGMIGELLLGGEGLARGYLKRADLTAEKFVPDAFSGVRGGRLYRTGDLTRYLADGNIEYLGRIDHQVKIHGVRIELGEIETYLSQHRAIDECVVLLKDCGAAGKRLTAYVVPEWKDVQQLTKELQKYLREKLPEYMVPTAFVSLKAMPLTPNGKVDRKALPAPVLLEQKAVYIAPSTPVEKKLVGIWSEVLAQNHFGVRDDFFHLGGDSMLATMVITRIRQSLKVELPQRIFFEDPTVAALAKYVDDFNQAREEAARNASSNAPAKDLNELSTSERAALVMRLKKKSTDSTPELTIPRRKDSGPVPLSFAQQRLWFVEQLGDSNYIVPATSRLTGRLDVAALEQSLNEIVRRHEALRTTFTVIDGQPMQVIAPRLPLTLPVHDLSGLPADECAVETRRLREEALRPFNLERGPLFRAGLLRLGEDEHLLSLTMHHIVSDGWSLGVLIRELATLYENFVGEKTSSLPELSIQYADFAVWQRQWLSGDVLDRQLRYWKEQLGDDPPVLQLPTDRPRPAVPTYKGFFVTCVIGRKLTEALKDLSRREGVSLYMTLLAAFKTLLARYANQDEVIVGTPIANRNWIDIENLIGFFVNTLVLKTDLSGNPPFNELLKRIKDVMLGAFAHQDVPFEKLVEELQPDRDLSRPPLFQVMFSLQNSPMPPLELSQVTMELLQDESTTAAFDLTLDMNERAQGMECLLEYSTEIFDQSTAQRILTHFTNLLESIVTNPQQRLLELPLMTEVERQQMLVEWNNTERNHGHELCIHQLFEQQAERTPEAIALIFGDERITYAELNQRANQLGHYLKGLGVGPETRAGILLERSVEMAIALLGVLKAGGAYVAFDPAYPAERLRYMLDDSGVSMLLTTQNVMSGQPGLSARPIFLDVESSTIGQYESQNVQSGVTASNLVYLVYTSGSTGRPKGILIEHRSLVNEAYAFSNNHRLTERDRLLQFASLSFDVAAEEFFAPWLSGGCVVMRPDQTVSSYDDFEAMLRRENITIVNLPASFWLEWLTSLTDRGGKTPEPLRRVIVGNEKTLEETLAKWQRLVGDKVEWCNAYGPSETTVTASNYEPPEAGGAREEKSTVPIGRPVMNVQMYVLDSAQQIVPTGVTGELYIGGAGVGRGYHKQPAQTAERFIPHPYSRKGGERLYQTGDAARYRPDGNIEFLGRVDEQIKIRGFRIEVGEIEAVLAQHASVLESVVMARDDGRGSHRLVAYVVGSNGELRVDELRNYLKQRLLEYMVPSSFVVMEALPHTPNGKVDRRALPDADGAAAEANEVYLAPRSSMERIIANVWQDVLKVEKVGVNDNFFGLGGHSLLLVHAQSRLSEVLRAKVSMVDMFKYPTISVLAEHLSVQRDSTAPAQPTRNQAETRLAAMNRQRQLRQGQTRNTPR
jgi:amino acid adenylation domain-containing protein